VESRSSRGCEAGCAMRASASHAEDGPPFSIEPRWTISSRGGPVAQRGLSRRSNLHHASCFPEGLCAADGGRDAFSVDLSLLTSFRGSQLRLVILLAQDARTRASCRGPGSAAVCCRALCTRLARPAAASASAQGLNVECTFGSRDMGVNANGGQPERWILQNPAKPGLH